MNPQKTATLTVQGASIAVTSINDDSYISLTDMSKSVEGEFTIKNWLRRRVTIEFLGIWEKLNNPNFNSVEFEVIRNKAEWTSYYSQLSHCANRAKATICEGIKIVNPALKGGVNVPPHLMGFSPFFAGATFGLCSAEEIDSIH